MTIDTRRKTLQKIREKYPDVDKNAGYIPPWIICVEAHPVLTRVIMSIVGATLGVLSMLPILPK